MSLTGAEDGGVFHPLGTTTHRNGNANAVGIMSSGNELKRGTLVKIGEARDPFDPATLFADHFHRLSKTSAGVGTQDVRGDFPAWDSRSDGYMKTHYPRMLTYRRQLKVQSQWKEDNV
jgi:hypothetical protein